MAWLQADGLALCSAVSLAPAVGLAPAGGSARTLGGLMAWLGNRPMLGLDARLLASLWLSARHAR